MKTYSLADVESMQAFGRSFTECLRPPLVIWLIGDLGAGKTVFAEGFIRGLGWKDRVKSPTYTLAEVYATPKCEVCHFDLYRLSDSEELETMGIRDYFNTDGVCLFEWADRMRESLPVPDLVFRFSYADEGRKVTVEPTSSAGDILLRQAG